MSQLELGYAVREPTACEPTAIGKIIVSCYLDGEALQWRNNGGDGVSNHRRRIVFSAVCSGADQRKHQSSASLAFVTGIQRWPVNFPHKGTVMPQSHPTTGPVRFLSPVQFLAHEAEWSARRNFTSVLFPWSHQAKGPVRLDTSVHLWFGWIIRRTPRVPRAMPARGPVLDSQRCRTVSLRTRKGIDTSIIGKNLARASYLAVRGPYGPLTGPTRAAYNI